MFYLMRILSNFWRGRGASTADYENDVTVNLCGFIPLFTGDDIRDLEDQITMESGTWDNDPSVNSNHEHTAEMADATSGELGTEWGDPSIEETNPGNPDA